MTETNFLGIPLILSAIQRPSLHTLSKTFSKSTKPKCKSHLSTLLDDYPQNFDVVNAKRARSEACQLTIYDGIKMLFYSIQYDLGDDFGDCGQDTDFSPIIANL